MNLEILWNVQNALRTHCVKILVLLFAFSSLEILKSQFQTSIGYPFPSNERALRGVKTITGNFFMLADNTNHPFKISNANGDLQHIEVNSPGTLMNPSKLIGTDGKETAVWMEKTVCGAGGYIIAANEDLGSGSNMLAFRTDLNCNVIWSRTLGSTAGNELAACIKEDGNGDYIMVGSRENNGIYEIQAVKLDCNGNQIWYKNYATTNSTKAVSVTSFATQISACNTSSNYFVTGVFVAPNGNDELLILNIDAISGNLIWINSYDIAPNAADYPTCIQGSCLFNAGLQKEIWVSGYSTDLTTRKAQTFMLKVDINGNPIWANNYEIVGDVEWATHFEFTNIGDFIITGRAEGLISPPRPATETGNCMLMKLSHSGNQILWNYAFDQGFASQGNSVEVLQNNECFISGFSYKADPPSGFDFNVLAIKTDSIGHTGNTCYHKLITDIIQRIPRSTRRTSTETSAIDFKALPLISKTYLDTQYFCQIQQQSKCDSLYTVLTPINNGQASCCYDLFIHNPTPNCFNQLSMTLSSTSFGTYNANPNWIFSSNGSQLIITHSSGFIPAGYINPGTFCLGSSGNPQTVLINYLYSSGGLTGKCEEQLIIRCPAAPFQACQCDSNFTAGPNLVQNGDFSLGNVGFSSNYIYSPPNLGLVNGRYSVRNSTNLVNLAWACLDHTLGTPLGNFLVVDATTTPGTVCWKENVNVTAGVHYSFCAFVNNLVNTSNNFTDPTVELWINNTLQASITLPEIPDNWVRISGSWTSTTTGAIPIEIKAGAPVHPSGSGCDFAVDDIAFHACIENPIFEPDTCCTVCKGNASWTPVTSQFYIQDMVVYDNKLIIGGVFNSGGFSNIAAWDGTNWFNLGSGANGTVEALTVHNGKLYACGSFSNIGTNIAEWSGPIPGGSWNTSFPGLSGGIFSRVTSLLSSPQGLIAGGAFQNPTNNIAMWNGISWNTIGTNGITVPNTNSGGVHALGLFNGKLIAAGVFSPPLNNIAQLNANVWQNLGNGINLFSGNNGEGVKAILQFSNFKLAVGGRFMEAVNTGNVVVPNTQFVAQWDGSTWSSMNTGVNTSFEGLYDFKIHCKDLYACGLFTKIGNNAISGVAHWDDALNTWAPVYNHPNQLIRALENFKADSNSTCDLFSAGEKILNHLQCATLTDDPKQKWIDVFPNPVYSNVHLNLSKPAESTCTVNITDMYGKRRYVHSISKGESGITIDFADFKNGVYILELLDQKGLHYYQKILKLK